MNIVQYALNRRPGTSNFPIHFFFFCPIILTIWSHPGKSVNHFIWASQYSITVLCTKSSSTKGKEPILIAANTVVTRAVVFQLLAGSPRTCSWWYSSGSWPDLFQCSTFCLRRKPEFLFWMETMASVQYPLLFTCFSWVWPYIFVFRWRSSTHQSELNRVWSRVGEQQIQMKLS